MRLGDDWHEGQEPELCVLVCRGKELVLCPQTSEKSLGDCMLRDGPNSSVFQEAHTALRR